MSAQNLCSSSPEQTSPETSVEETSRLRWSYRQVCVGGLLLWIVVLVKLALVGYQSDNLRGFIISAIHATLVLVGTIFLLFERHNTQP